MTTRPLPHVVFFFTDDQRFDTIAALGQSAVQTPNIDRLVRRGTAFTQAHIPGGTSGAVCMPSRAMLHTGRTLFHLQGAGESIPAEHVTLGEWLRAAGYRTFATGKWHNGTASFHRSFSDGDEIFFGGMADHWNVPVFHYDPTGRYDQRLPQCRTPMESNEVTYRHADHIHSGQHSSELICGAACRFIAAHDGPAPFFAYISFLAPHDPRTMPEPYRQLYDPQKLTLPPNFLGEHPFDNGVLRIRDELLAAFPRTAEETRRHLAEYYAMISHLDAQLGRVLDTLETKGILEDTLIVFAGDNGLALGQHGLFGKQSCYEHSVRVPLIFAGPGVPAGKQTDAYAYLLDIYPTLGELLGIECPASVEGRSLVPAIRGAGSGRDTLYFAYTDLHRAVKDRRHKLIEYVVNGARTTQLFDLIEDPWEQHNLAADPAHADTLQRLRTLLAEHATQWDDHTSEWGQRFWSGHDAPNP